MALKRCSGITGAISSYYTGENKDTKQLSEFHQDHTADEQQDQDQTPKP